MLAPLSRSAGLEDQLQLGDEVNSEIADGYTVGSSARHRTAVGDLPTSSVSAVQLVLQYMCSARTPPVYYNNSSMAYRDYGQYGPCDGVFKVGTMVYQRIIKCKSYR